MGIRCSCRVGQEAWSAFNSLSPEDVLTDAHSCTLPFQAQQHGNVLSRVRHVLGCGKVHHKSYNSDEDFNAGVFRVVAPSNESGDLNSQTKEERAPLPLIEDMLERQQSHKFFSVLDLKHGFHQMPLYPDGRFLTAMPNLFGTLQWRVLPMGVKNGPAQFQCLMEWILHHRRLDEVDENGNWKFA